MDSKEYMGTKFSLKELFARDASRASSSSSSHAPENIGLDFSMPKGRKLKQTPSTSGRSSELLWRLNPMSSNETHYADYSSRKTSQSSGVSPSSRYDSHQYSTEPYFSGSRYQHSGSFTSPLAQPSFQSPFRPMPRPLPSPVTMPLPKPKPRKSRLNAHPLASGHSGQSQYLFSMPPPIAEFSGREPSGKRKPGPSGGGSVARKRSKSSLKPELAEKVTEVSSRWRAVTDAHHTRLMDLIKLKHGEEAEFEEELTNYPAGWESVGRVKIKRAGGKGKPPVQRLSALRPMKGGEGSAESSVPDDEFFADRQNVKVVPKQRATSSPEERFRKAQSGNPDWDIFEQYYGAKKRILTTLKRAKPLQLMRRPDRDRSKLNTVLSQKPPKPVAGNRNSETIRPASDWGHAAFVPAAKLGKRKRADEHSVYEDDMLSSLPSLTSTPSHPGSDWQNSDVEADESRKKILTQLQKLNDKRARLEAQLTKIQKTNVPNGVFPSNAALQPSTSGIPRTSDEPRLVIKKLAKRVRTPEELVREQWKIISQKFIPLAFRLRLVRKDEHNSNRSKVVAAVLRDHAENRVDSERLAAEYIQRSKFMIRDMVSRWKYIDKEDKKYKKLQEKAEADQKRVDLEMQETHRQQRKLNFLITQTELYAHFMGKKIGGPTDQDTLTANTILHGLDKEETVPEFVQRLESYEGPDVTESLVGETAKKDVLRNVEEAFQANKNRVLEFNKKAGVNTETDVLQQENHGDKKILSEPAMFDGKLKGYQKKGISWLASLFSNGINGILADEMGLGKTVQSIAFLAHVAEEHGIWGPFLIVAPASTLHNWQQEFHRFVPRFKAVPYWGTTDERKILRQFWKADKMHTEQASFHVVVTSYQLIVQDAPYLKKINWQYMILDEAQAIKSSTSIRWKLLLDFPCRNRLLLTGTPIQNSMAELWALLHFIMPSLFDSHDEFNEWFSRDIESHAENKSHQINDKHLSRLHMILKPFMMRRIKRDVEEELGEKIEIMVNCPMTRRQQVLYEALKHKISIEDLLYSTSSSSKQSETTSSLMNLVMHFRKVCNHPELFERRDIRSPFWTAGPTFMLPKLVYRECSRKNGELTKSCLVDKYFNLASSHNVRIAAGSGNTVKSALSSSYPVRDSLMSFCQFFPLNSEDIRHVFQDTVFWRLQLWKNLRRRKGLARHYVDWSETRSLPRRNIFLIDAAFPSSDDHISPSLQKFIVPDLITGRYSYGRCRIHYTADTLERKYLKMESTEAESFKAADESQGSEPEVEELRQPRVVDRFPLCIPAFFHCVVPRVLSHSADISVRDRSAELENLLLTARNSRPVFRQLLFHGVTDETDQCGVPVLRVERPGGILGVRPDIGWSPMEIPDKQHLIVDSGKLRVLDNLLHRLKDEGHRVLIYSLMTKMMDILEEFMIHKHYNYIRLDGSSKISDRRDMVKDFQSRDDIFVFLLSTRAGGLGINLTAADTVIFYDSDWNPTVDQQAMDRAHRLGQTKQVTVYRLICRNTVEERILERAQQKSEIQRMVISGGDYKPDTLRPTEVVSLLLDDDEIKATLKRRENEMRTREQNIKNVVAKPKAPAKRNRSASSKPATKKVTKSGNGSSTALTSSVIKSRSKSTKAADSPAGTATGAPTVSGGVSLDKPVASKSKKKAPATSKKTPASIAIVAPVSVAASGDNPTTAVISDPTADQAEAHMNNGKDAATIEEKPKRVRTLRIKKSDLATSPSTAIPRVEKP